MLINIIYFLPFICCLLWLSMFLFKQRNLTQKVMCWLLLCATYYFFTMALYISPWTDYSLLTRFDMLGLPVALAALAVNIIYVISHENIDFFRRRKTMLMFIPAVAMLTLNILLYSVIGFDNATLFTKSFDASHGEILPQWDTPMYHLYHFITYQLFDVFILLFILATFVILFFVARRQGYRAGDVYRFFFSKGYIVTTGRTVCIMETLGMVLLAVAAAMGRIYLIEHTTIGCILMILLALFVQSLCYVEYYSQLNVITKDDIFSVNSSSYEVPEVGAEGLNELLSAQLRQAFDVDRIYTDPDLSLVTLAEHLNTNRTTLSFAINQTYGIPFRQVLANYRIEAAKIFMQSHPEATQEAVAVACGFLSAQAFNSKFKEVVGVSPHVWLLSQAKSE